jgi:iron only hydrogenase large subunit-like protein
MAGIDFSDLPEDKFDNPLGESTGAAAIFGTSGGVMEAALRTAYHILTGSELEKLEFEDIRGLQGIKETSVKIGDLELNIAVVNGIGNVAPILDEIQKGESKYDFIEVMSCPGGCINGGGQPIHNKPEKVQKRIKVLYEIDSQMVCRKSHENDAVKTIYKEFFKEPNSHKAHEILHTTYTDRKELLKNSVG